MADTAARGVDAVFIVQQGHEVGCLIDVIAIGERLAVQVAVDAGTSLAASLFGLAVEYQLVRASAGLDSLVVVDGIDIEEGTLVGVADILGSGKGKREETILYLIAAVEDGVGTVVIGKGLLGTITCGVVQSTDNLLKDVTHGGCHCTFERGVCLAVVTYNASFNLSGRSSLHRYLNSFFQRGIVDGGHLHVTGRHGQS